MALQQTGGQPCSLGPALCVSSALKNDLPGCTSYNGIPLGEAGLTLRCSVKQGWPSKEFRTKFEAQAKAIAEYSMLTPLLLYDLGKAMDATSRCQLLVDFFRHFWCQYHFFLSKLNHTPCQRKQIFEPCKISVADCLFRESIAFEPEAHGVWGYWSPRSWICICHFTMVERLDMPCRSLLHFWKSIPGRTYTVPLMSIFTSIDIPWYLVPLSSLASSGGQDYLDQLTDQTEMIRDIGMVWSSMD